MSKDHSQLNPRQWALYRFLKERGDQWTTQVQAAVTLQKMYYGQIYENWSGDPAEFHDSGARLQMTLDIRKINDSGVIQKVIISSRKGIKIANEEEFERYIRLEIGAAVRKLLRAKRKAAKGSLDGQMRFVFNSERDTVKAFLDSDKATGELLKAARKAKGLTANQVAATLQADGLHVDAPMISRFENGYCLPNRKTMAKLAEIYGVEPSELSRADLSALDLFNAI